MTLIEIIYFTNYTDKGDMYKRKIPQMLKWQAEGAYITKGCDSHCIVTHDQSKIEDADVIVMEVYITINLVFFLYF